MGRFEVGGVRYDRREFQAADMNHSSVTVRALGFRPYDALVGAEWLRSHRAVLDLSHGMLYIRAPVD